MYVWSIGTRIGTLADWFRFTLFAPKRFSAALIRAVWTQKNHAIAWFVIPLGQNSNTIFNQLEKLIL